MASFAVIGMSSFGYYVARALAEAGEEVLAIDSKEEAIHQIMPYVHKSIIANATDRSALREAGIEGVDAAIVCLGDRIDASILATLHLREMGVKKVVVKAMSEDHAAALGKIGATHVVFPERDEAERLARMLGNPNILGTIPITNDLEVVEITAPSFVVGKTLRELELRSKYNIHVVVIREVVPEPRVGLPSPDYVIKDSDTLVVLGAEEDIDRFTKRKRA